MSEMEIVPHLFRTEFSKIVAVLTKSFGLEHMETAEDIASETFLLALDTWPYKGVPPNPTAWLYSVAKNKVKNHLARQYHFDTTIAEKISTDTQSAEIEIDFSKQHIADSQLQMLFAVCHPSLSTESQICLALRILCGLGLSEIADAFLSNTETIHKRLQRAKEKLKIEKLRIEVPNENSINQRLDVVLHTIYLLFSEGYYSESNKTIIREELCIEALNLNYLLLNNPLTNNHAVNALMSLMCFQSSRLKARQAANGGMILYENQDPNLWDTELIEKGFYYLQQASKWPVTSNYYIEASIAYWHTVPNTNADKWPSILNLYDALLAVDQSPIVGLNRIWAYSKVHGHQAAIVEAEKLNLTTNHFYWMVLAELYKQVDTHQSLEYYQQAYVLSKTEHEKVEITKQMSAIKDGLVNLA
jgi:RNA polymerase sigma factor (sigma-70 family)